MRVTGLLTLIFFVSAGQSFGNQAPKRIELLRSPKTRALAKAFHTGKLPEPMRLPAGNIDQQTAALAKAVGAGDDSSTAALHAAILAAGYGVRDTDKSVMQTTEQGQGLIMESAQIAAIAKLYGEDYGVALDHLGNSFIRTVPALKDAPFADAILDGIRKGAKSNHPSVRFWARFIVELGKNSHAPYDLLGRVDPAKTRLDAIQVALILSRLTGDLAVFEKRTAAHHSTPRSINPQQHPCAVNDVEDVILDVNALASTTLFGILTARLGGAAATYGKVTGIANAVLAVFKFIISYANLKVDITMDGDKLIRTKNTTPGERRMLTATLGMDSGKWETINCLRPALNEVGLDVDVPQSGPLANLKVEWYLVLGGDSRGWIGVAENFMTNLLGGGGHGDGIVFLDALPGAPERSQFKQRTNKDGESQVYVVGIPQETDLSKRKLFEVDKGAGVRVDVQLKSMRIVDTTGAVSNIMDIAGNALAFLTGDPLGGAVSVATETLYRSNWYGSEPFYFIVKDWEPCTDQWQGTITYKVISKKEGTAETNVVRHYWNENQYYEARAELNGQRTAEGAPIARVEAHATEVKEWGGQGKGVCYRKTDETQGVRGTRKENTTAFSILFNPRTKEYSVSAPTPVVDGSGEHTIDSQVKGACNNPFNKSFTRTNKIERYQLSDDAPNLIGKGRIDPANPDEISGSATAEHVTVGGVKKTVTITWNLRRCASQ